MPELIYPYNLLHKVYDTSYPTDLNEDQMEGFWTVMSKLSDYEYKVIILRYKQLGNTYVAATIIKEDDKTILRLILNEDIGNDIVSCIDCSWNGAEWYIEDIQKITDYYSQYRDLELLENNFKY